MKRGLVTAFAAVVALGFGGVAAHAQQAKTGWYGQASGGWLGLQDDDFSQSGTNGKVEYDDGYTLSLAGGYRFGNGFRAEVEGGYGHSSFDKIQANGTSASVNGDINLWSLYAAGYYDFNLGNMTSSNLPTFTPYIGAGVGVVHSDVDNTTVTVGSSTFTSSGGNDDNFSAFGEVGVSFPVADRLELVPSVRYTWINNGENGFDDDAAWTAKVGLRYSF